ncbi:MAG: KpsF/GutQ family sugar-phosphate isomerase [Nitrospinota bacterium]|nr:KpsF/GutQ family sugar-phosphate isomerase [Nitrospinota bacterium]
MTNEILSRAVQAAVNVIAEEAGALTRLKDEARSPRFARALEILFNCQGTVYIIGLGKSGLVGQKIAATLTSTGAPAAYIHATDALHGDLGAIRSQDTAILISKSGQTREILAVIPFLKGNGNPIIAITNEENSPLAEQADVTLPMMVESEGCPLNLAPMTSSTAAMAIGDALAGALIVARDFKPESFARFHPAGRLGFLLTARVGDLLAPGNNPVVAESASLREAVVALVESRLGGVSITGADGRLTGALTDGDMKRIVIDKNLSLNEPVIRYMTRNPVTARPEDSAAVAVEIMENRKTQISILPVVDGEGRPLGILRLHDIIRSAL